MTIRCDGVFDKARFKSKFTETGDGTYDQSQLPGKGSKSLPLG